MIDEISRICATAQEVKAAIEALAPSAVARPQTPADKKAYRYYLVGTYAAPDDPMTDFGDDPRMVRKKFKSMGKAAMVLFDMIKRDVECALGRGANVNVLWFEAPDIVYTGRGYNASARLMLA